MLLSGQAIIWGVTPGTGELLGTRLGITIPTAGTEDGTIPGTIATASTIPGTLGISVFTILGTIGTMAFTTPGTLDGMILGATIGAIIPTDIIITTMPTIPIIAAMEVAADIITPITATLVPSIAMVIHMATLQATDLSDALHLRHPL